jgi:hypothetical protein
MNPFAGIVLSLGLLVGGAEEGPAVVGKAELELKAQFIGKVCTFVDWPANSDVNDPSKPFVLGLLGGVQKTWDDPLEDPLARALKATFGTAQIRGKRVIVKPLRNAPDVLSCQALFVLPSYKPHMALLLGLSQRKNILLFGDSHGFADLGIHFNMVLIGEKLRFEVNEVSLRNSGLKVDSLLLRQAVAIKHGETK